MKTFLLDYMLLCHLYAVVSIILNLWFPLVKYHVGHTCVWKIIESILHQCILKRVTTYSYSYVIYARHTELGPSLAQKMHVFHFIVCQLTLLWTTARGKQESLHNFFIIVDYDFLPKNNCWLPLSGFSFSKLIFFSYINNMVWSSVAYKLYPHLSRLMVRMCGSSLLALLITLDLRVRMLQEWFLLLLLPVHGQESCSLGYVICSCFWYI